MSDEEKQDHEKTMAGIASRKAAFDKSPFWFTVWDVSVRLLNIAFWLGFWSLVTQCTCSGCIWGHS
jgi:hypothetical protein